TLAARCQSTSVLAEPEETVQRVVGDEAANAGAQLELLGDIEGAVREQGVIAVYALLLCKVQNARRTIHRINIGEVEGRIRNQISGGQGTAIVIVAILGTNTLGLPLIKCARRPSQSIVIRRADAKFMGLLGVFVAADHV